MFKFWKSFSPPALNPNKVPFKTMKGKDDETYFSAEDENNDGFMWQRIEDPIRAKIWKKFNKPINPKEIDKPKAKYLIWDNGWQPYYVYDYRGRADIYFNKYMSDVKKCIIFGKIMSLRYIRFFVGDNYLNEHVYDKKGSSKGCSILIQKTKNKYLHVSEVIMEFSLPDGDEIIQYFSGMGNNGVPYPYAVGNKNIYLLIGDDGNQPFFPKVYFDQAKDVYQQFYGKEKYYEQFKKEMSCNILYKRYQLLFNN